MLERSLYPPQHAPYPVVHDHDRDYQRGEDGHAFSARTELYSSRAAFPREQPMLTVSGQHGA